MGKLYNTWEKNLQVPRWAAGPPGRIENRVRIPGGTATVSGVGRRPLAKASHWETGKAGRGQGRGDPAGPVSQETCLETSPSLPRMWERGHPTRKHGRGSTALPGFFFFFQPRG